ncbi:hypothetical protein ACFVYA_18345 [Amycolatopsis sp. NPDC058278]|uniref:hypothetical protein n=1 Tax=Amycolatopsis sp. NPDC058278 TaxID=3346417 RepID=UPI0036DC10CF
MGSFGDEVDALVGFHVDQDAKNAAAQRTEFERHRKRLEHLRQLAEQSAHYLRSKGAQPLSVLANPHPGGGRDHYRNAVIDCHAWPMGRLSLTVEGEFVSGHMPAKSTGENSDRDLIGLGIKPGQWYLPYGERIALSDTRAVQPFEVGLDDSEFFVYSHSTEGSRPISAHVKHYAAMLTLYGIEFTDLTWSKIHWDY